MDFKRTDLTFHRPSPKTSADYNGGGGITTSPVVHVPADLVARYRDLLNAVELPPGATPEERVRLLLDFAPDALGFLLDDEGANGAAREALNIEAQVRADRPRASAPPPSDRDRMDTARAVFDVVKEMKDMEAAQPITTYDKE